MKKSLFLIFVVLTVFVSCKDPSTEQPAESENIQSAEDPYVTYSKTVYQKLIGKEFYDKYTENVYDTIAFTENAVVLDGFEYTIERFIDLLIIKRRYSCLVGVCADVTFGNSSCNPDHAFFKVAFADYLHYPDFVFVGD